jgi:acid phosphatase family membrane protein YuiD
MTTYYFLVPLLVGLMTQFSKRFLNKSWHSEMDDKIRHLPHYGGMPSAHTAFAFSMITLVAYTSGVESPLFAVAMVIGIIILDDALRMRIFLGRHGEALKKLISLLSKKDQKDFPPLEKQLGHKPIEALVGAVVGVVLTIAILFFIK